MIMVSKPHIESLSRSRISAILIASVFCISVTHLAADTYRWKDKDGKVHYGAAVPAEYRDQPYDVLNNSGMVIDHVEDTSVTEDTREAEKEEQKRKPLISADERRIQSDRLLVIQYRSEEDINKALELEIAQLGYDSRLINQSYASTSTAIREQISQAADQQRSGLKVSAVQQKQIKGLFARRARDTKKRVSMEKRETKIRARFQNDLDRYRFLTSRTQKLAEDQPDQG